MGKFIEITKGHFRSPKIDEFNKMLEYLNTYKKTNFSLSELDKSSYESNAWLSGFLENNGWFSITMKYNPTWDEYDKKILFYNTYQALFGLGLTRNKTDKNNNYPGVIPEVSPSGNSYFNLWSSFANFFHATLYSPFR